MIRIVSSLPQPVRWIGSFALAFVLGARDLAAQDQQWELAVVDSTVTISWDRATLVRQDGNVLRVWIRSDYVRVQHGSVGDSLSFSQVIARYDFDCAKKVARIVQKNRYASNNMLVSSSNEVSPWTELVPIGYEARTLIIVCGKQPFVSVAVQVPPVSTLPTATASIPPSKTEQGHSGFHAGIGIGSGSVGVICDGCGNGRGRNTAWMFRLGGAVDRQNVVSAEVTGWTKSVDGLPATVAWATVVNQFYPSTSSGAYLKLGLGLAAGRIALPSVPQVLPVPVLIELSTFALEAGLGFDMKSGPDFSFTPFVDVFYGSPKKLVVNGTTIDMNMGVHMLHFGLAASWR